MTTLFEKLNVKEAPFFAKGDGATDDTAAINAAIAAAGTTGGVHFPAGTYKITSNITFGQNTTVSFIPGAILKPNSSSVLITMTSVDATLQQKIFDLSAGGKVTVLYNGVSTPSGKLSVRWWGAVGDGIADDTVAVQAALDAAKDSLIGVAAPTFGGYEHGVEVYVPSGNYLISQQLELFDWVCIKGDFNTTLIAANNNIAIMQIAGYFNKIEGLTFQKGKYHIKAYGASMRAGFLGSPESESINTITDCVFWYSTGPSFYIDTTPNATTSIAVGSNGVSLPTGTIFAASVTNFLTTYGDIFVTTSAGVQKVHYTGVSGNSFTGCTGGTGTMSTGGLIETRGSYGVGRQESSASFHFVFCEMAGACFYYGCADGIFYEHCHVFLDFSTVTPISGDGYTLGAFNTGDHISIDHFVGVPGFTAAHQCWIQGTGSIKARDMRFGGESLGIAIIHRKILPFNGMPLHIGWTSPEIFVETSEMDCAGDFDWLQIYDQFPTAIVLRTGNLGTLGQVNSTYGIWVDGYTVPISTLATLNNANTNIIFEGDGAYNMHRLYTSPFPVPFSSGFPADPVGFTDLVPVMRRFINKYDPPKTKELRNNTFPDNNSPTIFNNWSVASSANVSFGSADTSIGYTIYPAVSSTDGGLITMIWPTAWGSGIPAGEYTISFYAKSTFGGRILTGYDYGAGFAFQTTFANRHAIASNSFQRISNTFWHDGSTTKKFVLAIYDWPNGGTITLGLPMINKGAEVAPYLFPVDSATSPTMNNTTEDVVYATYYQAGVGNAGPASGKYNTGDVVINTTPGVSPIGAGGTFVWGWVCTAGGSPGTWKRITIS